MNYTRFVCLIAISLIITWSSHLTAQTPAMTRGVSAQMAKSTNATPVPEADTEDAWVVTVTADGQLYFGVKPVSSAELMDVMKSTPRRRDQNLYIKADARAPFGQIEKVASTARTDFFSAPVLLTNQAEVPALGKLVAPKGLQVFLTDPVPEAILVEISHSRQSVPEVKVNHQQVHLADLQTALNQGLQKQKERVVLLKVDGQLPFAPVAQIIDACTSVQAKVMLPVPML